MQVQKTAIFKFLEGRNRTFIIPVYQRDYAWKIENCEKLWEDILYLKESGKSNHFLGALVNIYIDTPHLCYAEDGDSCFSQFAS